jgi:methylenetetrahydrofolate reductase (NADPH)
MKISDLLAHKNLSVSFEIFPPKPRAAPPGDNQNDAQLSSLQTARELSSLKPDFISVTCGAGGTTRTQT